MEPIDQKLERKAKLLEVNQVSSYQLDASEISFKKFSDDDSHQDKEERKSHPTILTDKQYKSDSDQHPTGPESGLCYYSDSNQEDESSDEESGSEETKSFCDCFGLFKKGK